MNLKVWDGVSWKTKCCNILLKKIGEVVLILEQGEDFYIAVEDLKKRYRFNVIYSGIAARDHKSYVVLVKEKGKPSKLYWPEVKDLKKIYKKKIKKVKDKIKIESGGDWGI